MHEAGWFRLMTGGVQRGGSGPHIRGAAWQFLGLLLCLYGNVTPAAAAAAGYQLEVRPRICITLDSERLCVLELNVYWSAPVPANVCLRLATGAEPLQCWVQQREASTVVSVQTRTNTVLQLVEQDGAAILNQVELAVVSRDLRDGRRRRRHVWSVL